MNKNVVRALLSDAMAQVLDNLGFRILLLLCTLPVLFTWIFAFRDDGITTLFHWHSSWADTLAMFGSNTGDAATIGSEMRKGFFQLFETFVLDYVGDKFGIVFAVAAASFFMPRLLEKGSADTVFSKPISRFALMMSRYVAGLMFVFFASTFLIGGMYLGFRVVSGYDNSGMLWGIATLTYGFAVFHAVSLAIGIFTRSAAAAMLAVMVFMPVNCAVHGVWRVKELTLDKAADLAKKNGPAQPSEGVTEESSGGSSAWGVVKAMLMPTLNGLHYVLPKTSDTTVIARDLRARVDSGIRDFTDDDTGFSVAEAPEGFQREPRSSLTRGGLLWIAKHPSGLGEAQWKLERAKASATGSRLSIVKAFKKQLDTDAAVIAGTVDPARSDIGGHSAERIQWHEKHGDESRLRRQWVFQSGDFMYTLDYDAELDWATAEEREHSAQVFVAGMSFPDEMQRNPLEDEYERRFGWHSELKYNAWFSILSTLAFIAGVLALGWWKLARIDF
jgi:ABC-type transport system involved in multi-copper enzyme maturation permease subunit